MVLWDLLVLVPLGLLAGGLAGLLGIGGGLIFSPLLLWIGFSPHDALATSAFAIVPTSLSGTLTHLFAKGFPVRAGFSIGVAAFISALLFSKVGPFVSGWQLLMLQVLLYLAVAATIRADQGLAPTQLKSNLFLPGLGAVGVVAGFAGGLLGVGGGLLMVPLLLNGLAVPIHLAIRLSTLAVTCSAIAASLQFLSEGRGSPGMGLLLGGVAALAAQWSASRLERVSGKRLAWMLRMISLLLAFFIGRQALILALGR
ncbi:MAG: sulfite exporter TauE/SafE family protein [Prochlorococcus sp.]